MKNRILNFLRRIEDRIDALQIKALNRQIHYFTDGQVDSVIRVIAEQRNLTAYVVQKESRDQKFILIQKLLHELNLTALIGGLRRSEAMDIDIREAQREAKRQEANLN